ncbi:MAG: SGNH/GDSL hydrolase family protein [Acidimicrobiales bacterium]
MKSEAGRLSRRRAWLGGMVVLGVGALAVGTLATGLSSAGAAGSGTSDPDPTTQSQSQPQADPPLLAVVGASFSAGVGAHRVQASWPEDLARALRWRLVVSADPGAGYVNRGVRDLGPFANLAAQLHLGRREPTVVIIQGGHNDIRQPPALVSRRVESLVRAIQHQSPEAKVCVLTVFTATNHSSAAAWVTDRAIVAGARSADPGVMVLDPLASHWSFPRTPDNLHPSPAGHRWIAQRIDIALHQRGAVPRPLDRPTVQAE